MLLERFGQAEKVVVRDGFNVDGRVYMELEGSVPATMAKSLGLGVVEFVNEFQRIQPHIVLLIGDRYEAFAAAIAAVYMNIPLAHLQGGEVSGSIDESARHAITKLAHLHFPSTARAAEYIIRMGENPEHVYNFGCPSGDYIRKLDGDLPRDLLQRYGVGPVFDVGDPFLLVIYHPVTTQFGEERVLVQELIDALAELRMPTIWIWPNIDAGSDAISKALRRFREHHDNTWLHLVKNLEPEVFQKCLKRAACAVGNSSSFIRDSAFSGTPVVLVGIRQTGRECGENVVHCEADRSSIVIETRSQIAHGRYAPSELYGCGNASKRIVEMLAAFLPYQQKQLHYAFEHASAAIAVPDNK